MTLLDSIKASAERVTRLGRPSAEQLAALLRKRKPTTLRFRDDGFIPSHPRWPLVAYRSAVALPRTLDPAAVFEEALRKQYQAPGVAAGKSPKPLQGVRDGRGLGLD